MKFSIRKPENLEKTVSSIKRPSRRTLYVALASLLVLAVVVGSIALFQKHQENVHAAQAATTAKQVQDEKDRDQHVHDLSAENSLLKSYLTAGCQYLDVTQKAKATRGLVTIPTAMHCELVI